MSPSASANSRIVAIGNMPPAPFMNSRISSFTECSPCTKFIAQAATMPTITAHNTDVDPEPWIRLPSPVI